MKLKDLKRLKEWFANDSGTINESNELLNIICLEIEKKESWEKSSCNRRLDEYSLGQRYCIKIFNGGAFKGLINFKILETKHDEYGRFIGIRFKADKITDDSIHRGPDKNKTFDQYIQGELIKDIYKLTNENNKLKDEIKGLKLNR